MRNYVYGSRIVTELYCDEGLTKCQITTLNEDHSVTNHQLWITTRQFESAYDGDQDTKRAIELAYTDLVKDGRI